MENRCRLNEAMKVFWIFILGSLAGYILENFDNVRHINYQAVQKDGSMLCPEILNKNDYLLKTKNMNK